VIWPGTPSFPIVLPPEPPEEGEKPPMYVLVWGAGRGMGLVSGRAAHTGASAHQAAWIVDHAEAADGNAEGVR
jgi:hypothetical protein